MKEYRGTVVTVNGEPLNPRHDLRNHSPDGFEWGYSGSGPAQLALALMVDHFGDDDRAFAVYQDFKSSAVAGFAGDEWTLATRDVDEALARISGPEIAGDL